MSALPQLAALLGLSFQQMTFSPPITPPPISNPSTLPGNPPAPITTGTFTGTFPISTISVTTAVLSPSTLVTATFKPLPISGTSKVFGKGRDIGLWTVGVCNESSFPVIKPREKIMRMAPLIHELPNSLAQDVLTRKAASSGRATFAEVATGLTGLAGTGVTAAGIAQGSRSATYVGAGLQAVAVLVTLIKKHAPDPTPYLGEFLPDMVALSAGPESCHTWLIGAGLMPVKDLVTVGPVAVQ
jgi:hypothetical protein